MTLCMVESFSDACVFPDSVITDQSRDLLGFIKVLKYKYKSGAGKVNTIANWKRASDGCVIYLWFYVYFCLKQLSEGNFNF